MQTGFDEHQALASRSRAALLEVLRTDGGALGVDELASAVGLHVNTTREHLDRLVSAGLVTRMPEHRTTRGRPRILYRRREPAGSRVRAAVDEVLVRGFGTPMDSPTDGARSAGREAVSAVVGDHPLPQATTVEEARSVLVAELDRLGFEPEVRGNCVRLHACPVEDLARIRSEVVCAVHQGMTAEIVERVGMLRVVASRPAPGGGCELEVGER